MLAELHAAGRRYQELDEVSHKVLTNTLRRAERDGLVTRHLDPGRVGRVKELIAHLTPVAWEPVNFLGRYTFDPANARPLEARRPLRTGADETEEAA